MYFAVNIIANTLKNEFIFQHMLITNYKIVCSCHFACFTVQCIFVIVLNNNAVTIFFAVSQKNVQVLAGIWKHLFYTNFCWQLMVEQCDTQIKSIEIQLVRVETCGCAEGYAKDGQYIHQKYFRTIQFQTPTPPPNKN